MTVTNNKNFDNPLNDNRSDTSDSWWLILPVIYSIVLFLYSQWNALTNPLVVNDDIVQHLLWLYKYTNHDFIPGDVLVDTSEQLQPWGYWLLCRTLVLFFDPLIISKFFPLLPLMLLATFTFRLLNLRYGVALAMVGVILMCNFPFERIVGFNARAFGYPLVMAFLLYFSKREAYNVSITLIISALFYPVALVIGGFILTMSLVWKKCTSSTYRLLSRANFTQLSGLAIGILIVVLKSWQIQSSPLLGSIFSKNELMTMPEFSQWGRVNFEYELNPALFLNFDWYFIFRLPNIPYIVWILLVIFIVQLVVQRKIRDLDLSLIGLLIAGYVLGWMAQYFLPRLFLPQRYVFYTFVPFLYLLIVRVLGIFHKAFRHIVPMLLILGLFLYEGWKIRNPYNLGLKYYDQYEALYETIRGLPGRSLIAGPLSESSHIPMFCQQSVLMSAEASHAIYFKKQHEIMMPRIADFLKAYLSKDLEEVKTFVRKYDVNYLLIKKSFFTTNNMYVFRPFIGQLREVTEGRTATDYALMNLPETLILDIDDEYALVDCSKL